jgi:hypothetical protein
MMRTSVTVRARLAGSNPGATSAVIAGAKAMPSSAATAETTRRIEATAPASARAARGSSLSTSRAYTGMKDAERVPSPRRLRTRFGILSAARTASAAAELPK